MKKTNKTIIFSLTILAALIFFGNVNRLQAHPPSSISLNYVINTETLEVTISHSADLTSHYIDLIEIWVNDILNNSYDYTSQPSVTFTYNYQINVTASDEIKVTATCNQGGSATDTITPISDSTITPTDNTINISYISIGLTIAILSITPQVLDKRKKR